MNNVRFTEHTSVDVSLDQKIDGSALNKSNKNQQTTVSCFRLQYESGRFKSLYRRYFLFIYRIDSLLEPLFVLTTKNR